MKNKTLIILLIAGLLLSACAPQANQPTATVMPTITPLPASGQADNGESATLVARIATQNAGQTATAVAAAANPTGKVRVIWLVRDIANEFRWEKSVESDFEKDHPQIDVDIHVVPQSSYATTLQNLIDAGIPADIWSVWGVGFGDSLQKGLVADLTPFIQKDQLDLSDIMPDTLKLYTVDGKIMALPLLVTGSYVYYNKDLFDKYGVAYPPTDWDDTTWDWQAFVEKCKALTHLGGSHLENEYGCYLDTGLYMDALLWGQDVFPESAYKSGFAQTAFLDDPLVIAASQAKQDLIYQLHVSPAPTIFGDYLPDRLGMIVGNGWILWGAREYLPTHLGLAALPYGASERRDMLYTDPWMLSSQTAHPEEAWEFLKYLVSEGVQRSFLEQVGAPPVRSSLLDEWAGLYSDMTAEGMKEVLLGAIQYGVEDPEHQIVDYDQLDKILVQAYDAVISDKKPPAEVLPAANQELIAALQQIRKQYGK